MIRASWSARRALFSPTCLAAALLLPAAAPACRKSAGGTAEVAASADGRVSSRIADIHGGDSGPAPTSDHEAGADPGPGGSADAGAPEAMPGVPPPAPGVFRGVRLFFPALHRATAPSWLPRGPDGERSERTWAPAPELLGDVLDALPGRLDADGDGRGAGIAARLRSQARGDPADAGWERYAAQVVALDFAGRHLVYVNFVCDPERHAERLAIELVEVDDGGDCYFQVWFDPAAGEFPWVAINGEA